MSDNFDFYLSLTDDDFNVDHSSDSSMFGACGGYSISKLHVSLDSGDKSDGSTSDYGGAVETYKERIPYLSNSSRATKSATRNSKSNIARNPIHWTPSDDLLLLISVIQLNDLDVVFEAAHFARRFTFGQMEARWNVLVNDKLVRRAAMVAIRKLSKKVVLATKRRAPYSLAEEDLLCDIGSLERPTLEDFEFLLDSNQTTFYEARTPMLLLEHWYLLRKYNMLYDQRPLADVDNDEGSTNSSFKHVHMDQETKVMLQQVKRRNNLLELDLKRWIKWLNIELPHEIKQLDFDSTIYAILRGDHLQYAMRTKFITFGRAVAEGVNIDVDLSLEGPAEKISRCQGAIQMNDEGKFLAFNFGKRGFYINGDLLKSGKPIEIKNNSFFELQGLCFVFLINEKLLDEMFSTMLVD